MQNSGLLPINRSERGLKLPGLRYCTAIILIALVTTTLSTMGSLRASEIATEITRNGAALSTFNIVSNVTSCEDKLTSFVAELDALLENRATSIDQIRILMNRYFPLNHCNVDKAIDICRQSKYALAINRWRDQTSFGFSNKSENRYGYIVAFVLRNSSGDSEFPSVARALKSF